MVKHFYKMLVALVFTLSSTLSFANTTIETRQNCAMRNLDVTCNNGEKIKVNLFRTVHDTRGEIFLNINSQSAMGDFLFLYINNSKKPDIVKIINVSGSNALSKGAFLPITIIRKLQSATSIDFSIMMMHGSSIDGSLDQGHFDWMKRFGKACK